MMMVRMMITCIFDELDHELCKGQSNGFLRKFLCFSFFLHFVEFNQSIDNLCIWNGVVNFYQTKQQQGA